MDNYTRDIFDANVGTLDVVVYAVLASLNLSPLRFASHGGVGDGASGNGARAHDNAMLFITHFADRPIQAIKAIHAHSGLGFKDARDAWDQICETYDDGDRRYVLAVQRAIKARDWQAADYYASKL